MRKEYTSDLVFHNLFVQFAVFLFGQAGDGHVQEVVEPVERGREYLK
jgi:hypothetical protein